MNLANTYDFNITAVYTVSSLIHYAAADYSECCQMQPSVKSFPDIVHVPCAEYHPAVVYYVFELN